MISPEELKILRSFAERISPDDSGAHNNLAIVYYNKGLYDEAVDQLEKALKIDPNFVLARNNLDIILKKTGRLEAKVERLARGIDREPYDEVKTLELADTYRKLNRYSQSIIFYRKVLDFNQGSFEGHYGLGITLKLLGKYDDALEEVKKALEIKISPEVYKTLGEVYFNKGVVDLAIKNFQESISLDPSSAEGHFLLGFALGEKGKINESLEQVKKAIALNPALAQFEPNLPIDIKEHKGHWEFLKEQLGTPKVSENEYQVHYNLGMTYRNKGLFDEAKREFDECRKLNADNPDLHLALGEVNLFLNKFDEAIKHLECAYDSDFDSSQCTNALGVGFCLKAKFQIAVDWFQKALALQKDFVLPLNNLGVCFYNQNKIEEALQYYKKAVAGGSSDASYNLGMHYLKNGDYENALKLFSGETADEKFGKGLVFVESGKNEEAVEFFKKVLSLAPNHAGAYYNMGFIYTKLGKFKEGLDYIRKGIEIEPNYEKDKFRLSLEPELAGFGPYYSAGTGKGIQFEKPKDEVHVLEIPSADNYITNAESYLERNEFENALSMVDEALKLEPEWSKAVVLKAQILFNTGNAEDALSFLRNYTKNHPQDYEVMVKLGKILQKLGNLHEAKEIFRRLTKIDSKNVEWLSDLASIYCEMNELDEAISVYGKMYEMSKTNVAANLGFLKVYTKKRDFDKVKPYLDFLNEEHPDIYDFNVLAGIYYLEKNDRTKSGQYFQKAIELDASKALPYYHLGLIQVQKGDFENACDNWKKALLLSPDKELTKKIKHCLKITVELSEFLRNEAER